MEENPKTQYMQSCLEAFSLREPSSNFHDYFLLILSAPSSYQYECKEDLKSRVAFLVENKGFETLQTACQAYLQTEASGSKKGRSGKRSLYFKEIKQIIQENFNLGIDLEPLTIISLRA